MSLLKLDKVLFKKGMTGKELAEKTNVSQNTISNIVNGKNFPKPELLKSIAEVLNVDITELFIRTKLPEYDQIKHEQLVKVINTIDGKDRFKVKHNTIGISELTDINEINNGIFLMMNVLHVRGASVGEFDLYRLLDVYLNNKDSRKQINEILNNS